MTTLLDADIYYTDVAGFDSESLAYAYFNSQTGNLYLSFQSDPSTYYQYGGVPRSVYEGLYNAASAGHYYHENIKGRYARGVTVTDPAVEAVIVPQPVETVGVSVKADRGQSVLLVRVRLSGDLFEAASEILEVANALEGFDYDAEVVF